MQNTKKIRRNLLKAVIVMAVIVGLLCVALPSAAHATEIKPGGLPDTKANTQTVRTVMAIAFGILGSFALLSMVLSGFKYIASAGDPQKTSEAKNGVVFAVVGLMIAIAAEGLIVFVIKGT